MGTRCVIGLGEMPANLTPEYLAAEQRYRQAKTTEEKIAALEEMLATLPKHKGTEKIYADIKSRLAKLRRQEEKKKGPARHKPEYFIEPEGVGQVVLLGAPNSGKSALLAALTKAEPLVADYPFATRKPLPGMMDFEDVKFQLVDTPSLDEGYFDPLLPPLIRNADAAVVVVDLSSPDCLDQPQMVSRRLAEARIELVREKVSPALKQTNPRRLPAFIAATKADHEDAEVALELLREVVQDSLDMVVVSVTDTESLDRFRRKVFEIFDVIRVYPKKPGKEPEMDSPFVLPRGSTVIEFARKVHKMFAERFAYARGFGPHRVQGQRLGRDDELHDGDIVELHMT